MNPYIIIGVMVVIDLITLPIIIKKILKKDGKNKGIKIAVLIAAFVIVEAVCSFFCIESNVFFDREGNQYKSAESIVYYDREGVSYTLRETGMARKHFVSTDGRIMRIAERAYVDKDGYLVFDLKNEFKSAEKEGVYKDADGNEYYKAEDVSWKRNGEIQTGNGK
ncbi:MAG: hypothetical protein IK955_08355 [Clostridia bacterium]|nr:hypothetical protein [Clostridia bacterium]